MSKVSCNISIFQTFADCSQVSDDKRLSVDFNRAVIITRDVRNGTSCEWLHNESQPSTTTKVNYNLLFSEGEINSSLSTSKQTAISTTRQKLTRYIKQFIINININSVQLQELNIYFHILLFSNNISIIIINNLI